MSTHPISDKAERLMAEAEAAQARAESLREEANEVRKAMAEAMKPLEEQLAALRVPYAVKIADLGVAAQAAESEQGEKWRASKSAVWDEHIPSNGKEAADWLAFYEGSPFRGEGHQEPVKQNPRLEGFTIFGFHGYSEQDRRYVAFDNATRNLAGWLSVKSSDHPGDDTEVRDAYANGRKLAWRSWDNGVSRTEADFYTGGNGVAAPLATWLDLLAGKGLVCVEDEGHLTTLSGSINEGYLVRDPHNFKVPAVAETLRRNGPCGCR